MYHSSRLDTTRSTCQAHTFWLCRACRTARLDTLVSTRRTCRVEMWRAKWNVGFTHRSLFSCVLLLQIWTVSRTSVERGSRRLVAALERRWVDHQASAGESSDRPTRRTLHLSSAYVLLLSVPFDRKWRHCAVEFRTGCFLVVVYCLPAVSSELWLAVVWHVTEECTHVVS